MKPTFLPFLALAVVIMVGIYNSILNRKYFLAFSNTDILQEYHDFGVHEINTSEYIRRKVIRDSETNSVGKYIIDTPGCKIPNLESLTSSMKKYFISEQFGNCSEKSRYQNYKISSTIGNILYFFPEYIGKRHFKEDEIIALKMSRKHRPSMFKLLNQSSIQCFYEPIERVQGNDNAVKYSGTSFSIQKHTTLILNYDVISVYCNDSARIFYENVHYLMHRKIIDDETKIDATSNGSSPPGNRSGKMSVIIFGMDGVSRQNLLRINPKTFKYLTEDLKAFDFKGFNRVGESTIHNLTPALIGQFVNELTSPDCFVNTTHLKIRKEGKSTKDTKKAKFDGCPFVWNDFKKNGYVTSYLEDAPYVTVFNFLGTGFEEPPTDHYGRPYIIAATELMAWQYSSIDMPTCIGNKLAIKIIQDYTLDFLKLYQNEPTFSLLWSTALTHSTLNEGTLADELNLEYLKTLKKSGTLDNTIVIFMSDHGMNYGDFRATLLGKYESNLPYLFAVVPEWFRTKFKTVSQNLEKNTGRQVTHFDIYSTLMDIASSNYKNTTYIKTSPPKTQRSISLFREIPDERTCMDIGFEYNYCSCQQYIPIKNHTSFENINNSTIHYLNKMIEHFPGCAVITEFNITKAYVSTREDKHFIDNETTFTIQGIFSPGKATIEFMYVWNSQEKTSQIIGRIDRINGYGLQSHCIDHKDLKEFCICKDYI